MEADLHCCYSNSPQSYGILMDSPPPPYYGGCGDGDSGSEDFSFEGTMFSVMGSGRKYIPCPHCRLEVGAFETLLLKSDGLRKRNNCRESIFLVNVLERYDVIGNGDSLDGRPPLYTIPNSSHFGAEYCRHCNEADSVSNKPPSCDSTRAETSSPASSDIEQLSTSLEDNSSLTNRYSQRSDQPSDKCYEGNDKFYHSKHTEKNINHKHRSHNGYCQRKSAKTQDETTENNRNNTNNHTRRSQPRYIPNHKCNSPEYSSPWLCKSYHKAKHIDNDTRFNSSYSCRQNSFVGSQDEVFLDEDIGDLLQNKIGSKHEKDLKCREDELYFSDPLEEDIESLKTTIANLIEDKVKYWLSSHGTKRKLASTENRISYSKANATPSMKINRSKTNDLNHVSLTESTTQQKSSTPNQVNGHSNESITHSLYSNDNNSYSPHLQKLNLKNDHHSKQYQYQCHQEIPSSKEEPLSAQTPGNDSGFFSPSPKILPSPSAWQHRKHESDSKSFRHNSHYISPEKGFKYPKPVIDKSDDSDQYETELNTRNRKRNKLGNTHQSYSTESHHTSSKGKTNADDYDQSDQVKSPRENINPKIKSPKKGKFRRSTDQNENQKSDPELLPCTHERKFRQMNGDVRPERSASLKNTSNSCEEVEELFIEHQNRSQVNALPPSSRVDTTSPVLQLTEWETDIGEQLSTADNLNTSLSETSEATDISITSSELRITDDSYGNLESLSSVAKRFDFDTYSDQATSSVDLGESNSTKEWQASTDHYVVSETSSPLPDRPTRDKVTLTSNKAGKTLKGALKLDNDSKSKHNRHVEIKGERSVENNQVQIGVAEKDTLPKTPSIKAVKKHKDQVGIIGTFVEGELDDLYTMHKKGTLYVGGPFQADQQFRSWLADIKCNDNGQYIVSDWSNCCVQMFSTVGLPGDRVTFKSGPWSLALMDASVVACTIPRSKQIAFLSHGARLAVVGLVSTERCYWGIAVTRDQNLVCSCILGIDLLSTTGQSLRTLQYNEVGLNFFIFPQYITVGENDVIYVSDSCGTYLLGIPKEGNINFEFKPIQSNKFITPRDLEYGPDGYVYIADTETNKIYRLTKEGDLDCELFTAKDGIKGPLAITLRQDKIIITQKDSSILILPL